MKIHYLAFTVLWLAGCLFLTAYSCYLYLSALIPQPYQPFIIATAVFSIFSTMAIVFYNGELEGNYYVFFKNPIAARKKKSDIKDVLLMKMKDAEGAELDKLFERVEKL